MFLYVTIPNDYWSAWQRLDEFMARKDLERWQREEVTRLFEAAKEEASDHGWEGDISQGPYVSALPNDGEPQNSIVVAWKQSNNGTTFVASPVRLPWMGEPRAKC